MLLHKYVRGAINSKCSHWLYAIFMPDGLYSLHLHRQNLTIWFLAKKIICIFQANTKLILIDGTCWLGLFCWIIACLNPKPRHNSHSLFCRLYRGECHNFLTQFYSQKKLIWCTQNLNKPLYSNSSLNRCLYFCKNNGTMYCFRRDWPKLFWVK